MMMNKHKILVMGAGRIGVAVSTLLARTKDYCVYLSDVVDDKQLPIIEDNPINYAKLDINQKTQVLDFIKTRQIEAVVSCLPYYLTIEVAKIAASANIDYFDPTEDVATTNEVYRLAKTTTANFAPQCGLAPGFISIAANSLTAGFKEIEHIKMRVGALTPNVNNGFNYAFTWSVDGVVNEYIHPCLVVNNGVKTTVSALDGKESLVVDNEHYEAFYTSGGIGSMVDTYAGRVKNMDYKTMRYNGHCDKMKFILQDLKLAEDPELAKKILMRVIPHSEDDKVIVYVSVLGQKDGQLTEKNYTNTCLPMKIDNTYFSAIQLTTATGICAMVDLVLHEKKLKGLVLQEQVSLAVFLNNRFGAYYNGSAI